GPTGPTGIASVSFTGSNEIRPALTLTLTLPPITVLPGQAVDLDAFATAHYVPFEGLTIYGAGVVIQLFRDRNLLTQAAERVFSIPITTSSQLDFNPSVTWIDFPPPGTYQYRLEIISERFGINDNESNFRARALKAKVLNIT
ncbi:hypothetical protein COE15_27840, partial [Bacillus cereus]|uniref:hypothetical protein n=1 Tax=Bacillus sp. AFS023182 TaxID=2033492 RepID=UPI000BF7B1C6